jgi:hypothetical protein
MPSALCSGDLSQARAHQARLGRTKPPYRHDDYRTTLLVVQLTEPPLPCVETCVALELENDLCSTRDASPEGGMLDHVTVELSA